MEHGLLRLRTSSLHRTADLLEFVRVLDDAYESVSALDDAISMLLQEPDAPRSIHLYSRSLNYSYRPRDLSDAFQFISGHRKQISRFVDGAVNDTRKASEDYDLLEQEGRLIVRSFQMNSPGFWEFIGSLNPLEVLRNYLNDRHKRRQDREYREAAEADRLDQELQQARLENDRRTLENWDLEDQIAFRRVEALQRAGISKKELHYLTRRIVTRNLDRLEVVAERTNIDATAEIESIRRPHPRHPW